MSTAMAAAFERKGVLPRDAEFWLALAKFRNNGGSQAAAEAMVRRAYGEGHLPGVDEARKDVPSPDHSAAMPIREGHIGGADKAVRHLPSRSIADAASGGERGGHRSPAEKAIDVVPLRSTIPVSKRDFTARSAVQEALARSLFDTIHLPDGRRLREVRWHECPALARQYRQAAHILTAVHRHAIPVDHTARLDQIVGEADLARIVAEAEKNNA